MINNSLLTNVLGKQLSGFELPVCAKTVEQAETVVLKTVVVLNPVEPDSKTR